MWYCFAAWSGVGAGMIVSFDAWERFVDDVYFRLLGLEPGPKWCACGLRAEFIVGSRGYCGECYRVLFHRK